MTRTGAPKLGRNDPCYCGSGRKYKDCHLRQEEEWRSQQLRLRNAQDNLLQRILALAADADATELQTAFDRYWNGRYQFAQLAELNEREGYGADRFMVWFAFDYRQSDGQTLVSRLAATVDQSDLTSLERQLLLQWLDVRLRPYHVERLRPNTGADLRDLLTGESLILADSHASLRLELNEVIVGHLVPVDTPVGANQPNYYLAGPAAHLTPDTAEPLRTFATIHLEARRRHQANAEWPDLLRERSEIFNHFILILPTDKPDPERIERFVAETRRQLLGE
ncbi:MAG: SEC-C domain-containing protein [Chloroflexus sp.]